ncbi:uncharacterized protein LOC106012863 [Aplysia californica]|uniref:Uncharacterized protein LOC106012863 n=1 Tax=Aplysia californica TaxID=6500 RepID=A0ABM1A7T1_APLCA|nr:uncharacterized protein LOC106012863 [Aplysia californica]
MESREGLNKDDKLQLTDPEVMFIQLHQKALSLGIKQHQMARLKYVRDVTHAKWHRVTSVLKTSFLSILGLFCFISISWALEWPVPRDNLAKFVWRLKGENPGYFESEICLLKASQTAQDLARPPISCEFCEDVHEVPRVSQISPDDFERKFAYSGHPVIVTDGASNWTATTTFSFDFFRDLYRPGSAALRKAESRCQFFPYQTEFRSLGHVFKMDQSRAELSSGAKPWYVGWSNCDVTAGEILRKHYGRPYFLPENAESSRTDWLFMGSPGYGAHLHVDNVHLPSWQAQVAGHKRWTLQPPPECYFRCIAKMEVTVRPGEIIVVDTNRWYHATQVTGQDISITIGSEYD